MKAFSTNIIIIIKKTNKADNDWLCHKRYTLYLMHYQYTKGPEFRISYLLIKVLQKRAAISETA